MTPRSTIVLPFQQEGDLLAAQLAALDRLTGVDGVDVVLVGSAADERTLALARAWAADRAHARLDVHEQPLAPGEARNRGAALARTELVAFCDADDEVDPRWLAEHEPTFDDPGIGVAAGPLDEATLNPPRVRRWRTPLVQDGLPQGWWYLPYAPAANLVVRRSAFDAVGGFDPTLRACEDVDLCWRLQRAGHGIAFSPRAVVRYRHRPQLRASMAQAFSWARSSVELVDRYRDADLPPRLVSPGEVARWMRDDLRSFRSVGAGRTLRDVSYLAGLAAGRIERWPRALRRRPRRPVHPLALPEAARRHFPARLARTED